MQVAGGNGGERGGGHGGRHGAIDAATLEYIQAMLRELRGMATGKRTEMLSYLIEMAYVEVSDLLRDAEASGDGKSGLNQK